MTRFAVMTKLDTGGDDVILKSAPGERILARFTVPELAKAIRVAHAARRQCVVAGGIETPDVPRLLALKPDVLAVPEQHYALLMAARPAERPSQDRTAGQDRIFIRDLVLPVRIGAYASERGREQRVRFGVRADLTPRGAAPQSIADIFSYDIVLDTIETIVAEGHVDLLETLAEEIAQRLLQHQAIAKLTITLEKLDLGPAVAGVEIVRGR